MSQIIQQIEELLEKGRRRTARDLIAQVDLSSIPRAEFVQFSTLSRECGLPIKGLKLLYPIVYSGISEPPVGREEIIEHAKNLYEVGAHQEAISLLINLNRDQPSEVEYLLGCNSLKIWDIKSAYNFLKSYLTISNLPSRKEAEIKFARTLRILGYADEALSLLRQIDAPAYEIEFTLQVKELNRISLQESSAFANEVLLGLSSKIKAELIFEYLFHQAVSAKDTETAIKWLFGCPYSEGRQLLCDLSRHWLKIPEYYHHRPSFDSSQERVFDLAKGREVSGEGLKLKMGQYLHQLLIVLLSDRHFSISTAALLERTFQEKQFDPWKGPTRIHQLIRRLKATFAEFNVPLSIKEKNGKYKIEWESAFTILYRSRYLAKLPINPLLLRLELDIPQKTFSLKEASQALNLTPRFVLTLLQAAHKQGIVSVKKGSGPTKYSLESSSYEPQ